MLKIAMIAPIELIHMASRFSDCAMWLTHLLSKEAYFSAINSRPEKQPSFLDNSFFELGKAMPLEEMKTRASRLNEEVTFILPDGEFQDHDKVSKAMVIPTSQDELWVALNMLLKEPRIFKIGISCIHAKRSLGQESFEATTRHRFISQVLEEFSAEDADRFKRGEVFHFLGLDNEPWDELKLLYNEYNASLDSSAFVWPFAKTIGSLKLWEAKEKYREPVDFEARFSIYTKALTRDYLEELKGRISAF